MGRQSLRYTVWLLAFLAIIMVAACQPSLAPTTIATPQASPLASSTPTPTPHKTVTPQPTQTSTTLPSPTIPSETLAALDEIPGEVFLRLRTRKEPFHEILGKLPAACLTPLEGCPPVEIILDQKLAEQVSLEESAISIVPDGKSIWFLNSSSKIIRVFDLSTKQLRTITTNLTVLPSYASWSPDSEWLAISVQGTAQDDVDLILINQTSGEQVPLIVSNDQRNYPVAWLSNDELIMGTHLHETGNPHGETPAPPIKAKLSQINIHTAQTSLLVTDVSSLPWVYLSPNGQQLLFQREQSNGQQRAFVFDISSGKETEIKKSIFPAGWSSDGQWVLIFRESEPFPVEDSQYGYYVLHPDGSDEHRVIGYMSIRMCFDAKWFIDGRHLLHTIFDNAFDCRSTQSEVSFSLVDPNKDYFNLEREKFIALNDGITKNYTLTEILW